MKLKFYVLAVCAIALAIDLHAQCSGHITLSSQADVNSYQSTYGCTAITGSLTISGNDITDLTPLSGITSVGTLLVSGNPNLESLHGLENLTTIGANCACTAYGLTVSDNPKLPNIDGLSAVTSIAGMVNIKSNAVLSNINGLSHLDHIGTNRGFGDQSIIIQSNPMIPSLAPFAGLSGSIGGIDIIDNDALTNLQGLHHIDKILGGGLQITGNASLTSISALSKISTVNLRVEVSDNAMLPNLNGLRSLYGIESLSGSGVAIVVSDNPSLVNIDSLSNFQSFDGPTERVTFTNNPQLTRGCGLFTLVSQKENSCPGCVTYNFSGSGITKDQILAGGPCKPSADCGSISFTSQADVNAFPTTYGCSVIHGSLTISGNDISDLSPLSGITTVSGVITIKDNPVLTSINGLSHLTTLGDGVDYAVQSIIVENNPMLASLAGFSNVRGTVGELHVDNNDALTDLVGFQNITAIAGYGLSLTGNDALTSISALSKVTMISGAVRIMNNPALPNLNGLQALTEVAIVRGGGVSMIVSNNSALMNVDSLSNFVELRGPSMTVDFSNNPKLTRGCGLYPLLNDYVQNCSSCVVTYNFSGSGITKDGILAGGPCSSSQPKTCTGDIGIASQADVDSFQSKYGCSVLTGYLFIRGADITNLDGLSNITSVDRLYIDGNPMLENVDGLKHLTTVPGNATGTPTAGLRINNNPALTNIDGLSSLTSVGQELVITNNASLRNVEGLASLTSVGSNPVIHYLGLDIENNAALTTIAGLRNLASIAGYVSIINNDALVDFDGLQKVREVNKGGLAIVGNDALTNLNGLAGLQNIYGSPTAGLRIADNASLTNVDSLYNLHIEGPDRRLAVTGNTNLDRGCGLYNIIRLEFCDSCPGTLTLSNNGPDFTKGEILANGPCDGIDNVSPTAPTDLVFSDVTDNSMTVSFKPGVRADGYIVLMRSFESSLPDEGPVNGFFYNVGNVIGCCSIVVGNGMDSTLYIVYQEADVDYYFDIIPWIRVSVGISYFPDMALSGYQRTLPQPQPYPNPFVEELVIPVTVSEENSIVNILITDQLGRPVSQMVKTLNTAGRHEIRWNRTDSSGNKVLSGVYTYSITTPNSLVKGLVMAK